MSRNKIIPYDHRLRSLARELRKNSTLSEILFWEQVKGRKLGFQFHRQVPINRFIVDFYCHELILAIEIDGASHDNELSFELDKARQHILEALGITVIRITDEEVKKELPEVIRHLESYLKQYL